MEESRQMPYVLGLDIGSNSIGWAMLVTENGKPVRILNTGVRIFEAGMSEEKGTIEQGREESRNKARREARQIRRQLWRRARKMKKLLHILQRANLLPTGEATQVLEKLDKEFLQRYEKVIGKHLMAQVLPYFLRKKALDEKLEPYELGRALYHLAQRRGFKSGRKAPKKEEEEKKRQKETEQLDLSDDIKKKLDAGELTLGEYLIDLAIKENHIRNIWTSRTWYETEFEKIWSKQAEFYSDILTSELKKEVHKTIFFQRPLKTPLYVQETRKIDIVGNCPFEVDEKGKPRKRAPWALPSAQKFRYLQKLNDFRIIPPDGPEILLKEDKEKREILITALETKKEMTFGGIRKRLKLSKEHDFNFPGDEESKIPGNKTATSMIDVFGEERWLKFSLAEQDQIIKDILKKIEEDASYYWTHLNEKDVTEKVPNVKEKIIKYGKEKQGLDDTAAQKLFELVLEDGYCNLSEEALAKLLPELEKGTQYATAVKEVYPDKPLDKISAFLPSVVTELGELRNPTVMRVLTELRRVVNALIKQYGKPENVRIELAREMKKPKKERQKVWEGNQRSKKERDTVKDELEKETGTSDPKAYAILKGRLAKECKWHCPYCNKGFSWATLQQAEVDHIIPWSRSGDNSFFNKTLICWECNHQKSNRTPFEAFGNTDRWEEILTRVNGFTGFAAKEKLSRFKMEEEDLKELFDEFTTQQLNDTKYASKVARNYLGLLYGGLSDEKGLRVQAGRGGITAHLRNVWQVNFLGGGEKKRDDHRQHAVDAIVIALTDATKFKMLSEASKYLSRDRIAGFAKDEIELPWQGFTEEVREKVEKIVVSRRVSRKVQGPLHKETIYGKVEKDGEILFRVRKKLEDLTETEVKRIADKNVKKLVFEKMEELGTDNPGKAFKEKKNHPCFVAEKDGRRIPIHKVRINARIEEGAFSIGKPEPPRWVESKENHHMEIVEVLDENGQTKGWDGHVVSLYEAMQRPKNAVIQKDHGQREKFLFSIAPGEIIRLQSDEPYKGPGLYRVTTVPKSKQIVFKHVNDARPDPDIPTKKKGRTAVPTTLLKWDCNKVTVDAVGKVVIRAND